MELSSLGACDRPAAPGRIAIFLPTLHGGGAERVLLDLAKNFGDRGYPVDLVLMAAPSDLPLQGLIPANVRTVNLDCRRLWTSGPAFARYLRSTRPAGIVAAMPLANAIAVYARFASRTRMRLVLTEHNARSLAFGDVEPFKLWVLYPWVRFSYRFADTLIAVSGGVADRLRRMPGIRRERVRVVYNPAYNDRLLELASLPSPHPWLEDTATPVIVGSGRLEAQKDFPTLIRAFARVRSSRDVRLVILGEGSERSALERLVAELGLSACVHFPGFVTNPWAYVARARVFALSSIHEGLGNVLIEAMACGIPVVSTDCPAGPGEILEGGRYGPLVAMHDPAALAAGIIEALDRPIVRTELMARARFFSIEAASRGYLSALGFAS